MPYECEIFDEYDRGSEAMGVCAAISPIVNELGFPGQLELIKEISSDTLNGTGASAFRPMSTEEKFVYTIICQFRGDSVESFKDSLIPLEVMEVVKIAKQHLRRITVWSSPEHDMGMFVLIGSTQTYNWDRDNKDYIIARWGRSLPSLSTLRKLAVERKRSELLNQCLDVTRHIEQLRDSDLIGRWPTCSVAF